MTEPPDIIRHVAVEQGLRGKIQTGLQISPFHELLENEPPLEPPQLGGTRQGTAVGICLIELPGFLGKVRRAVMLDKVIAVIGLNAQQVNHRRGVGVGCLGQTPLQIGTIGTVDKDDWHRTYAVEGNFVQEPYGPQLGKSYSTA